MAAGSIAVAATLALGVAGAAAAPNPGFGTHFDVLPGLPNLSPTSNAPFEQAEDGPQTANVPTLAWVGEDVRLVACDDAIKPNPIDLPSIDFQQANWSSGTGGDLWTGDQAAAPAFDSSGSNNLYTDNTSSAFFFPPTGVDETRNGCVSADISSVHAGLDEVTLSVTDEGLSGGRGGQGPILDPEVVYQEQFIVIWMTANPPKITEASNSTIEYPTTAGGVASTASQITPVVGAANLSKFLGDGSTPGTFASLDQWGQDTGVLGCFSVPGPGDDPFFPCANLTPDTNNGLVQIRVTGSFPVEDQPPATTNEQYFQGITGGGNPSTITLPTQWVALANLMAESSTSYQGTNGSLWDIHGSPTNVLSVMGHAGNGPASAGPPATLAGLCQYDGTLFDQTTDVVDDCLSTGGTNPTGNPYAFSRVFGDVTSVGDTIGPYDAEAPNATLLSDGNLNTDDAPMPALPVTVSIAKGGLGGLYGISKWLVYSHDFDGAGTDPNGNPIGSPLVPPTGKTALTSTGTANLYNPYYQEYIPSTERPISEASGITGVYDGGNAASSGDDFPGFSDGYTDPYTFWTALKGSTTDSKPVSNGCLEFDSNVETNRDEANEFAKQNPVDKGGIVEGTTTVTVDGKTETVPNGLFYYATPDDPTSILVYTDERGEAYVDYNPGIGWYNNIGPDGNGACDLGGLYGKAIGTSSISASVQYPYEEVPYQTANLVSNTLVKTVDSEWEKTLTAYPKSNLSPNEISVVVAHAQNINGTPFSGEEVCVGVPANDSVWWDDENPLTVTTPAIDTTGSNGDAANTSNNTCGWTGTAGNVAFDVSGSDGQTNVDVQAVYVAEHITRDVNIPVLGQQDPVSSTQPPTVLPADPVNTTIASGDAGSTGSTTSSSTGSAPVAPVTAVTPSVQAKTANVCKVESVRLSSKLGKFSVSFKLSCSTAKSESVTIRAYRANGKVLRTYKETVKTGKTVKIAIGRKVARVTVIA
ncbi:MAG: hypothetical protein ABSD82_13770 [Solirubrobacteraceae bacterium]|jgi:hypothetical protein